MNFLNTLQHVNIRYNWICHAYCLMDNHYHLLIETPGIGRVRNLDILPGI